MDSILRFITLSLTILAVSPFRDWPYKETAISYVHRVNSGIDTFFDRAIAVVYERSSTLYYYNRYNTINYTTMALGVMITEEMVLSSYNPYRGLERYNHTLPKMIITAMTYRLVDNVPTSRSYQFGRSTETIVFDIQCGRKVIPENPMAQLRDDMRHGTHRPKHDLIVFRVAPIIKFTYPVPKRLLNFDGLLTNENKHPAWPDRYWKLSSGIIKTELAGPDDMLDRHIIWTSIGHRTDSHINTTRFLHKEYDTTESLVDCDKWFPRLWGRFFCIKNHNNFVGLNSGALLFSGEKLYGVGSFALFKFKKSILVFTDVRLYYDLIYKTCTRDDQIHGN